MVDGGEQKPGAATGARAHGPRRGHRPGTMQGLLHSACSRSSRGYALAGLVVLAFVGAWSLGVVGCTAPGSGYTRGEDTSGSFFANLRQSPGEASRLAQNAHYYKLMGQPELGLKELELAHQQNPDNLQIADLLAQNYEELGKFEAARQLYQEALTRRGSNPVMANNFCFSYYTEGRWQEAETCFRKTLARDPGNVAARNNLGLLYCRLGRRDEARRLWQETEGTAAADAKLGQALAALGLPDRAVYAQKSEPAPSAARVTPAPTPKAAVAHLPAPVPAKVALAQPVAPKETAKPLATKLSAPTPVALNVRPEQKAPKQAAASKQAVVAGTPGTATKAAPLTVAERVDTAIEVRNGTWTKNLAHETRSLLHQEGFTVAKIGNHIDFGATKTIIYYRPEAERVARAVGRTVFSGAELAPSVKLNQGMDIKVLLGSDLLENPQFIARLNNEAPPAAPAAAQSPATDKLLATKAEAKQPAAGHQEPLKKSRPKAGPGQQPLQPGSKEVKAQPPTSPEPSFLTAAERVNAAIEVRNGTWTKNLAHETRSLLHQEGFTVAKIGNHIDFGAAKTMIYYRPGVERVAQAVGRTIFPGAKLEPSLELSKGMDIKILLGADLLERPQLMARLVATDK
jgi:cytochrome c-type biogenesis protein CcmH/NrfG